VPAQLRQDSRSADRVSATPNRFSRNFPTWLPLHSD
jgi:hypothetical protein